MSNCDSCGLWTTCRKTLYADGSEVVQYQAPAGKGFCAPLNQETNSDFGCNKYAAAESSTHTQITRKSGAPWQHSHAGPCPDCTAMPGMKDGGACPRCAGTSKVRHYDDGYIGEEQTRLHPKERPGKPRCGGCNREVESEWRVCPTCGHRLDALAPTEVIAGLGGGT